MSENQQNLAESVWGSKEGSQWTWAGKSSSSQASQVPAGDSVTGVDPWDRRGFFVFKAASAVIPTVILNSLLKSGLFQPGKLLFSM